MRVYQPSSTGLQSKFNVGSLQPQNCTLTNQIRQRVKLETSYIDVYYNHNGKSLNLKAVCTDSAATVALLKALSHFISILISVHLWGKFGPIDLCILVLICGTKRRSIHVMLETQGVQSLNECRSWTFTATTMRVSCSSMTVVAPDLVLQTHTVTHTCLEFGWECIWYKGSRVSKSISLKCMSSYNDTLPLQ